MKTNNIKTLLLLIPTFLIYSCGGSDENTNLSDLMGNQDKQNDENPCEKMDVADFDGFLGIYEDTPESEFKNILPGVAHGDYTEDELSFTYIFDDLENVSTYVTVNAESGNVEYLNILLNSYSDDELLETQDRMKGAYDITECHDQFFMMSQKEIEKIMGDDNSKSDDDGEDYWLEYSGDDGKAVHFYFPNINDLGCIMIRVYYDW